MKILKVKLILHTAMCVLIAAFIFTSCEQIEVANQSEPSLAQENERRNYSLEQQLETLTQFEKPLRVEHSGDRTIEVNHIDFIIKSNDEDILNHFSTNSVAFKFNNTIPEDVEERRDVSDNTEITSTENLSGFEEEQKFVQIILTGLDKTPEVGARGDLGYSLEFSDELASLMNENNIAMVVDFGPETNEDQVNNRHSEYWLWWNNKAVDIRKWCDGTTTKTDNYYAKTSSTTNWHLNQSNFSCTSQIAVCCLWDTSDRWVRRVVVQSGSISSVSGAINYCPSGFNSCLYDDYYPDN